GFFADSNVALQWKGYAQSFIMLVAAISCPILGAIGDTQGMKKRMWAGFALSGALLMILLILGGSWKILLVGYILSNIAYNLANLFYDSFITDVTDRDRMHRVSTTGFAVGYFGGGTMMLIITAVLMFTLPDQVLVVRLSFALTALWWILFSIPMAFNVKQTHYNPKPRGEVVRTLFSELGNTVKAIYSNKGIFLFAVAYFFYIDGVGTVISMATAYGTTLNLSKTLMIVAILVTQVVAVPFSLLFGWLANRFGGLRLIIVGICVYVVICIMGFYMGYSINSTTGDAHAAAISRGIVLFFIMAGLVGTSQGGIQALSRSQFGKMVPREKSNEYFGFFNIFSRFASIIGPALMAMMSGLTHGRSEYGILSIIILFAIGGVILITGNKRIHASEIEDTGSDAADMQLVSQE
ncbi:MAG: MFS transporter, partial [Propionibacteriaceae bacterium]|nr:MFS transporter [Propionibacteriaceae bacterium]